MNNHSETHYHRPRFHKDPDRVPCISIEWKGWGYGIDRCNQHVERIVGGLRYSTRTATLVAALDGEDFGAYIFRTAGGRYFHTAHNWPLRYDQADLRPLSTDEALTLYSRFQDRGYAALDPLAEAFPDVAVVDA